MKRRVHPRALWALLLLAGFGSASSQAQELASQTAKVNGITVHYVRAGEGPPVVLIHGFPQDWYEYHAIMPRLAKRFTVVAVDLRGVGGSSAPPAGYDAATMSEDVYQLVSTLKLKRAYIVGHDIGAMVAYAYVRRHPEGLRGAMLLDVPLPGLPGWDEALSGPTSWHVHFMQIPELPEKLIADRQATYFGYFLQFGKFSPADAEHFAKAYAAPAQLHAAFEMYRAFPANAKFNAAQRARNDVPIFYAAGEKSPFVQLVPKVAAGLRANGCTRVETGLIKGAVHYVVADAPDAVAQLIETHAAAK